MGRIAPRAGKWAPARTAKIIGLSLLLLAAIAFVYWDVPSFGFVNYDDPVYVSANPHVAAGLTPEGVRWAFTTMTESNWHPLTWLSLMLDASIAGTRPWIFHLTNILLHAATTLLLFLAFNRMTARAGRSALVAALFAVHPLHVESVAWIAERKDVLSGLFWMLTLLAWARYTDRPSRGRYRAALVCFGLGLMAKPMLVSLPIILFLLDLWPLGRLAGKSDPKRVRLDSSEAADCSAETGASAASAGSSRALAALGERDRRQHRSGRSPAGGLARGGASKVGLEGGGARGARPGWFILEKCPFVALSAASSAITLIAQSEGGSFAPSSSYPLPVRIGNAIAAAAAYLGRALWPVKLAVFYPHSGTALHLGQVAVSAALLAGITLLAIVTWRTHPSLLTGWGWYLVSLAPVSGIVQVGLQARADRYTYLPLVGVFVMVAWGAPALAGAIARSSTGDSAASSAGKLPRLPALSRALTIVSIVGLLALSVTARAQAAHWRDSVSLFSRAIEVTGPNGIAEESLGAALHAEGRTEDALIHFRRAVEILPEYTDAHMNLGSVLMNLGRTGDAEREFRAAARADPSTSAVRIALAAALEREGKNDEAIVEFREAVRLSPSDAETRARLGRLLMQQGARAEAIAVFSDTARLWPGNAGIESNLGLLLLQEGRFAEAAAHLEETVRLGSPGAAARSNLGLALARLGRLDEAAAALSEAVRIDPNDTGARINLGLVLLDQRRFAEAEAQFAEAARLAPNDQDAIELLSLARKKKSGLNEGGRPIAPR